MTYIVTFEIDSQIRKENLKNMLKEFESCCPIHENAWAVFTDKQEYDILHDIKNAINSNDRIFVMRSNQQVSWLNPYGEEHVEWMMNNL